ncbi:methyltransferase MtaB domain-containing protein [Oscillatoria laete-virens NRMC-F 0139]|nr:methyltransferase MtaB domain-containing protein [Oscillatoria laete-virens]MDL5053148.1 methyltransferase MtaB domain-containing protein [Oscillatoria laete-virens NRMC-F 0139]
MNAYQDMVIKDVDQFLYGNSPLPVKTRSGLVIGGGTVYPELNFTLPAMNIEEATWQEVRNHYQQMITEACQRAVELHAPGLVVEFETLPPMTIQPEWGADITAILRETLDTYSQKHGLAGALRITPNDIREHERPPLMRSGHLWESMLQSFDLCCRKGADFLSIESTGGKEVNDEAMIMGDLKQVTFALGILACRDMKFLWEHIVRICGQHGVIPAGDSACGFGNTAMVLADKRYIPKIWAAVIRVMTVPRTLACYEAGARGPSKDCAYEGPYIKAITGCPISMEGRDAACAHLSPVGNISQALADLWSNESVQNVKLLGAMAPTVSLEQLVFTTRFMNTASSKGDAVKRQLRDIMVDSDYMYDPQAYVLKPDVVLRLSRQIVEAKTPYERTKKAALAVLEELRTAAAAQVFPMSKNEQTWMDKLSRQAEQLPDDEGELIAEVIEDLDRTKVRLEEYGIQA